MSQLTIDKAESAATAAAVVSYSITSWMGFGLTDYLFEIFGYNVLLLVVMIQTFAIWCILRYFVAVMIDLHPDIHWRMLGKVALVFVSNFLLVGIVQGLTQLLKQLLSADVLNAAEGVVFVVVIFVILAFFSLRFEVLGVHIDQNKYHEDIRRQASWNLKQAMSRLNALHL